MQMAGLYRLVSFAFWVLGLLTTVVTLVARAIRPLRAAMADTVELRSLLLLAGVFFLGAIATWAVERTAKS
jgi:hypothetical protein